MLIAPKSEFVKLKDLLREIREEQIQINPLYQRSGRIWPSRAKSFLVETVLLGLPIPRVLLHDIDPPRPPHFSDIIDGQQRCTILLEFQNNGFALTAAIDNLNNQGKHFRELTPRQRAAFENYLVPVDRYKGVTHLEIRQVFRRLNYYTAPLNAAEQRHAQFFGEFGRFVERQSLVWSSSFQRLRVFTRRQLTRKADQQLMAEVVDAMLNGLTTPTAKSLRDVYKRYDRQFPSAGNFQRRLDGAREQIDGWTSRLVTNRLMRKHYHLFSLLIALMHVQGDLAPVRGDLEAQARLLPDDSVFASLAKLDEAVRRKVTVGLYAPFWRASHEKTNVRENRLTRCRYFYRALTGSGFGH